MILYQLKLRLRPPFTYAYAVGQALGAQSRGAAQTSANLPRYTNLYSDSNKIRVPGQDIYIMVSQSLCVYINIYRDK